jgi:predicted nucleotidyltransferase
VGAALVELLRDHGGRFAFLHGSRVTGGSQPDSDLDIAVWFGRPTDDLTLRAHLPAGVDLLVLDERPRIDRARAEFGAAHRRTPVTNAERYL